MYKFWSVLRKEIKQNTRNEGIERLNPPTDTNPISKMRKIVEKEDCGNNEA